MDTQEIAPAAITAIARDFSINEDQVGLLTRTICKGATTDELAMFMARANALGLDPFSGQIHAVKRYDGGLKRMVMAIQIGIDGFRLIAKRSGSYRGQTPTEWCGTDGVWCEVWLDPDNPPAAARVGVKHADYDEPLYAVARFASYVGTKRDGTPNAMWSRMPDVMIAKVAEALAIRKAFPAELAGVYSHDEMEQADNPAPKASAVQERPADVMESDEAAAYADWLINAFEELEAHVESQGDDFSTEHFALCMASERSMMMRLPREQKERVNAPFRRLCDAYRIENPARWLHSIDTAGKATLWPGMTVEGDAVEAEIVDDEHADVPDVGDLEAGRRDG